MKLLFDQNISRKLVDDLAQLFPDSTHVSLVSLQKATDAALWEYARRNNFTIVTQDSDFYERSLLHGFPPKVIWLRTGNTSTRNIEYLLKTHHADILAFGEDKTLGCLTLH